MIFKRKRFSSFLSYLNHFCLKSFSLFSAEGLRGRGQLRVQERQCPANKIALLLHKHNGKEQDSGNNATYSNSFYYDNYKTRLSMTRYLALQNKYQKKK